MQIYKDMSIGTAKPTLEEMQEIRHYMIDCVSPEERFSVSQYKTEAVKAIEEVLSKKKVPIVVGGTGLYIDSLIYGIDFQEMTFDENYRKELEEKVKEGKLNELYEKAKEIDPYKATGKNKTEQNKESLKNGVPYRYVVFALNWDREILYDRINRRVDIMIEQGLIKEVEDLIAKYGENMPTAMQGLGYKEVKEYLDKKITKEEMIEKIKQETRRYAKRQLTWFRKNKNTIWLDAKLDINKNIETILESI